MSAMNLAEQHVRSDIGPRWQAWLTIVDRFLVLFEIRVARYFPIPPLEKESQDSLTAVQK